MPGSSSTRRQRRGGVPVPGGDPRSSTRVRPERRRTVYAREIPELAMPDRQITAPATAPRRCNECVAGNGSDLATRKIGRPKTRWSGGGLRGVSFSCQLNNGMLIDGAAQRAASSRILYDRILLLYSSKPMYYLFLL